MSTRRMPSAPTMSRRESVRSDISADALARWNPGIRAADKEADRSISVYDVIGQDFWTGEGVTAKRIAAALRSMGSGPVTVNINSPGGDMFEGLAIYNLLREHEGEVTVKVLGLAASAASVIAMAGDVVQMSRASFLMIHNSWVLAAGDRHELLAVSEFLEPFDNAMAEIYAARTGIDVADVSAMLDAETWMGGTDAIAKGFADEHLASDQIKEGDKTNAAAVRRIESALRSSGLPRSEAMRLISEFKASLRDAAGSGRRDAAVRGASDSTTLSEAAALAASLTVKL